jgi:hypothetical protein
MSSTGRGGGRTRRVSGASSPRPCRRRCRLRALVAALALVAARASAWESAQVDPRVDNLDALLAGCEQRREAALERQRAAAAWASHQAAVAAAAGDTSLATQPLAQTPSTLLPECAAATVLERLGAMPPGVWGMVAAGGDLLFATVNLPAAAVLVSTDGGRRWHYRHLFLPGHNVDRGVLLRGIDYRAGLLAVASRDGLLLSRDGGRSFRTVLAGEPLWAVAISPHDPDVLVAGGEASSRLTRDGGETWSDLRFSAFVGTLSSRNPFRIDHITSLEFDPLSPARVYVGTGSHVYRLRLDGETSIAGSWQAMEGIPGGRVLDDSTVYNIEVGSRLMISTCNGVYWADRVGEDPRPQQVEVSWRKFRDPAFSKRSVGGPKGNLRSYFVAEDPSDRERVLVADFAALYEGRRTPGGSGMSWRRVEDLPYYSPASGYPEYTAIVWPAGGAAVVGSRYRGIFVQPAAPARVAAGGGASCLLH